MNHELQFALGRVENIVDKVENVDYKHFIVFPNCSKDVLSVWSVPNFFLFPPN